MTFPFQLLDLSVRVVHTILDRPKDERTNLPSKITKLETLIRTNFLLSFL